MVQELGTSSQSGFLSAAHSRDTADRVEKTVKQVTTTNLKILREYLKTSPWPIPWALENCIRTYGAEDSLLAEDYAEFVDRAEAESVKAKRRAEAESVTRANAESLEQERRQRKTLYDDAQLIYRRLDRAHGDYLGARHDSIVFDELSKKHGISPQAAKEQYLREGCVREGVSDCPW